MGTEGNRPATRDADICCGNPQKSGLTLDYSRAETKSLGSVVRTEVVRSVTGIQTMCPLALGMDPDFKVA